MAQLKIRDLHDLLRQAPRRCDLEQDGIRLVYDGTSLHLSTTDAPDTVIARTDTCGLTTEPWDVTAYRASITSTEVGCANAWNFTARTASIPAALPIPEQPVSQQEATTCCPASP
ncbi:hypothetical protein [Streptomyces sp. H23]|uniref:hypothetical protein n=1 Tax=unclassified Streptomyces TaxID=2593676 RepID=UPI00106E836A|nr:hypothetical protein [Streptomyces sp. H23]